MDALFNHDAELTCLGAVLADNRALSVLEGVVRPEHFADPGCRAVYTAMLAMGNAGRSIDELTLRDEMGGELEHVGGVAFIASLTDGLPRIQNVEHWGKLVASRARRRSAVLIAEKLIKQAGDERVSTEELLESLQTDLSRLMDTADRSIKRISDVLPVAFHKLEEFAESKDGVVGLSTGLPSIDSLTGGMKAGEQWIIGGRPSRGKSSFCTQVAVHVAGLGKKVLVFSMEMPPPSVVRRMLLSHAAIDRWDLRRSDRRDEAWLKVTRASSELSALPIWFDGREAPTLSQIRAAARQHEARHGLDLIVVDYLQRCTLDAKVDRWVAVGDVAKGLKNLALALDVPVLAACQLNADAEEKRPTMADLAQARQVIAAEADLVAFLHPDDPANWRSQDFPQVNFILDKQRDGATTSVQLSFERPWTRFVEMPPQGNWAGSVA